MSVKNIRHGHARKGTTTGLYESWHNMLQRCANPKDKDYANYGGRGITVCDSWLRFDNFKEDMGDRWEPGLQIDRLDNSKGYFCENCRWVTSRENNRNRRNNIYLTYGGVTVLLLEWSEKTGIPYAAIYDRIYRYNWSIDKALTTPVRKYRKAATRKK